MKLVILLLMFLVIGALLIISNNNLALYKDENIHEFKVLYIDWLDNVYKNAQTITGNLVKMRWLPENKNI